MLKKKHLELKFFIFGWKVPLQGPSVREDHVHQWQRILVVHWPSRDTQPTLKFVSKAARLVEALVCFPRKSVNVQSNYDLDGVSTQKIHKSLSTLREPHAGSELPKHGFVNHLSKRTRSINQ